MESQPKLKILHVCENYKPDYGGGAGIYIQDVCRFLAERGHEVRVLCTEKNDGEPYSSRFEVIENVRVDRVNLPYFREYDPDGWQLDIEKWKAHEKRIKKIIEGYLNDWTPDIVNYNTTRPFGEEGLLAIAGRSIPIVAILHEGWLICARMTFLRSPLPEACSGPGKFKCLECMYSNYDGNRLKALLKLTWRIPKIKSYFAYRLKRRKKASRKIAGAISYSDFIKNLHQPHIANVRRISLGIDLGGLPDEKPARPRTPLRFGFIGGSQPIKGLPDILDAAVVLKREGLSFELLVWGPDQKKCEEYIRARRLEDRVRLRGTYQSHQLWEVYNEMDVALMATTVSEAFGRVPIEAAAARAITIAPKIGGLAESIRHEVDGLLFRFRDEKDLEKQMRRILTEPDLFHSLQKNLKPVVNTRTAIADVERFYYEVLGLNNGMQPEPNGGAPTP